MAESRPDHIVKVEEALAGLEGQIQPYLDLRRSLDLGLKRLCTDAGESEEKGHRKTAGPEERLFLWCSCSLTASFLGTVWIGLWRWPPASSTTATILVVAVLAQLAGALAFALLLDRAADRGA